MVQLSDELVLSLDRVADRDGVSRSALIRTLLEQALRDEREASVGREIAEGYKRIPQATPDEWGDPVESADHSARELMQRLAAEERREGHPPW